MKKEFSFIIAALCTVSAWAQVDSLSVENLTKNKEIVLKFYHDLWATNNTDKYAETVAETYVVHDIGDRKNVTEPAIEQKQIADFFWQNGDLKFELDYQVAEGDLVMTRWWADFTPTTFVGKFLIGEGKIPIINVVRIKEGKIVEFWNHRHDIDTPQTMRFTFKGLLIGLAIALIPTFFMLKYKRQVKRLKQA